MRTRALARFARRRVAWRRELETLCRIPGLAAAPAPSPPMRRSAEAVAALARRAGLERVDVLEIPGAHPYVCGEWRHAPGAPTVLLYSHHDLQPPGDPALWRTPAFAPAVRGGRLYARGAVDDKGGIVAELAAIGSHLEAGLPLPVNVRVLVDGEEEVGSPHFGAFLARHRARIDADVVVVLDTPNLDTGVPSITRSLRGGCAVDVEVATLTGPLHSGRGGGLAPDPIQILCRLIARIQDDAGRLTVPGLLRDVARRQTPGVAVSAARLKRDLGMLPGVRFAGDPRHAPLERTWSWPSVTVIAFEAPHLANASNQIVPSARARLSMRTVPDMDPARAGKALVRALTHAPPSGARVQARVVRTTPWWSGDPAGPEHAAATRAMARGYGRKPVMIGTGGSIGFVETIARTLQAPCLLLGLEDPGCNAHAENESLHLGDWEASVRSLIHLFHELPPEARWRGRPRR